MNKKLDKVALIKDLQMGLIDPTQVPSHPIICSKADEMFIGLMMTEAPVIFVGEARKALNELMQSSDIDHKAI